MEKARAPDGDVVGLKQMGQESGMRRMGEDLWVDQLVGYQYLSS